MCAPFISMTILGLYVDSITFQAKISTADKVCMGSQGKCSRHDNRLTLAHKRAWFL